MAVSASESGWVSTATSRSSRGTGWSQRASSEKRSARKPWASLMPRWEYSPERQKSGRPMRQARQVSWRQGRRTVGTTRSPGRMRRTDEPTSSTSPTASCPRTRYGESGGGEPMR